MRITRWDQVGTSVQTNEVLFLLSRWHLAQCSDEDQVGDILRLLESKDVSGLCHFSLCYTGLSIRSARHLRQILAFFSKRNDIEIGIDTRAVAWKKAKEAEQLCSETNDMFRKYFEGDFSFSSDVESVLFRAQRKISAILGDVPSLEQLKLRFGPGATTQVKKKDASARRKLSQMFCSSEDLRGRLPDVLAEVPLWSGSPADERVVTVPVQIDLGKITFVPKNAKTMRTISKEPMLNTLVQLGVGSHMAECLAREGVDITDQTLNQRLAREGSITGALATLDLSSASDCIACMLVMSLLPFEWYEFLCSIRTGESDSPDGRIRLEKFSSMGNGFTFPLETIIFYALAYACVEEKDRTKVNAYGDDLIVPTYAVPLLTRVLTSCGFIVNYEKSFSSGNFRESCGKDYLSGIDIRPCYIKGALSGNTLFTLHNFYVRNGHPEPATILLQYIDVSLQIWGPDGFGDGHLLGDFIPSPISRDRGWGGYTFETYTFKTIKAFYRLGADYVFPSYSIYTKEGPDLGFLNDSQPLSRFLNRRKAHGILRPERSDSDYHFVPSVNGRERWKNKRGDWFLTDTLPGADGYKRVKIYYLGLPPQGAGLSATF